MAREAEHRTEIAARIRELRDDIPQHRIADKVGVTLRAYQEWEAGGGIAYDNLVKLAEVFRVSEEFLRYGPDAARPPSTQMDRIEAKLDAILGALGVSPQRTPDQARESAAQALEEAGRKHAQPQSTPAQATRDRRKPGR